MNKVEIFDAKYEKINLEEMMQDQKHLKAEEREKLKKLLRVKIAAFQGTRGKCRGQPIELKVKKDAKPFYAYPYSIPKAYEETTKKEVERLCQIGLLNRIKTFEWAAPCFIIPKKDGTVRFLTDFRGPKNV